MRPFFKPYPLARRMMLIVILWSTLFTIVIAAAQVYFEYTREMALLNARLLQIRIVEVPSLTNSIWHFDDKQIEIQLQGMLNLEDIRYVEVQVVGGSTFKAGQIVPANNALSQTVALEYTQNGENFVLGKLLVDADIRSLQQRVLGWLFSILLTSAIQIFLLAGFILFIVEWLLTRPLNDIVHYAETLNLEHLEEPLVLKNRKLASPGDEMELLALKLNEMRHRLMDDVIERKRMEASLRESERNYREIFNATSEAIFIHDAISGRILQVNASMLHMYGYATDTDVLDLMAPALSSSEPPFTQMEAERYLQNAITEGPQIFEWRARKKTGEAFWVEVSLRSSSIGGENRILAVVRDISERKRAENQLLEQNEALIVQGRALEVAEAQARQLNAELEKRVEDRTLQLAALNQELEAFSYSVAHDLRAPLRRMDSFSQIILEDHGSELNIDVKKGLQRIHDSTQNLSQMVDALLALSRLTRDEIHPTHVDLSVLVQLIADDLHQREPERQVEFIIAPDLVVKADKHLLQIMLENLFSNAWKFTAQRRPAQIEFGCIFSSGVSQETSGEVIYFVRDNGAGFDMSYADRLFSPFQRLHSESTFSGTGIGLTTVKRIIQRHEGRIWAESAVDQGATFYFTLLAPTC
jgi:PAS domain S-box-containing protein